VWQFAPRYSETLSRGTPETKGTKQWFIEQASSHLVVGVRAVNPIAAGDYLTEMRVGNGDDPLSFVTFDDGPKPEGMWSGSKQHRYYYTDYIGDSVEERYKNKLAAVDRDPTTVETRWFITFNIVRHG